jgi:hypothetical protein
MLNNEEVRHGYWGARRLAGDLPDTYYAEPSDFPGGDALCLFRSPPLTLSPAQEKRRIERWREALPEMKIKTMILACRTHQALFDSATRIAGLEAFEVKNSSVTSIASLENCRELKAFEFGSRQPVSDLKPLRALKKLASLRLFHMREMANLDSISQLHSLEEFGLLWQSIDLVQTVESLEPLASLQKLQLLWLDVRVRHKGLTPLHALKNLVNLQVLYTYPHVVIHKSLSRGFRISVTALSC